MPDDAVMLVEWPDRAGSNWPPDRIDVSFTLSPEHDLTYRSARVSGFGAQAERIARVGLLRSFLQNAGYAEAERRHMQGDASTRAYELLTLEGRSSVLMNAPRRPDGPPVRGNKSYSAIARLAEDVKPFVAMARGLRARGFSAPDILAADLENGFLILEDLGTEPVVAGNPPAPIEERYETAVDVLLALHWLRLPDYLEVIPGIEHTIPRYGVDTFLIEAELLLDWYIPHAGGHVSATARAQFTNLWREAMLPVLTGDQTWVLRDYHSPNLLWLPQREGIQRAGLLDFQDALIGPPAYDLASLLQDARIDVPEAMELKLLTHYCKMRKYRDVKFSVTDFAQTYAIVAAQRSTKILGIFARLDRRDGKPQYLRHMPRIWGYLQRSLSHPALAALRLWYRDNVPAHRPPS
jgi:aminoglycoside/choline kinase family phosphotransferase